MKQPVPVHVTEAEAAQSTETLYAAGYFLFQQGNFADAAAVFRWMLQVAPTDERSWLALAECHERVHQPWIALELYSTGTVAAEPSARCWLGRGRALSALERPDEAEAAFAEAVRLAQASNDVNLTELVEAVRCGS
ncbi:MAG TPA: tetratricopeptide repeat protein [Polyangiaceae bacterium]